MPLARKGILSENFWKTVEAAFSLLEEMANNNCLWPSERQNPPKKGGRIGVDTVTALQA